MRIVSFMGWKATLSAKLTGAISQIPVLDEVRNVALTRNGHFALISYEHKVCAAFDAHKIRLTRYDTDSASTLAPRNGQRQG